MKQYVLLFLAFAFLQASVIGQVNYNSTPNEGNYVSCPATETCGGNTYDGGVVQMRLKDIDYVNDLFKFEIKKCDGNTFNDSGRFYLYRYAVCNTYLEDVFVPSGSSSVTLNYSIPSSFTSGTRGFYGYFHSNASGQDFYAGQVNITAVTPPPFLEHATCISAPSSIDMFEDLDVTFDVDAVHNLWSGKVKVFIAEVGNSANNLTLGEPFLALSPSSPSAEINVSEPITVQPGNYRIYAFGDATGSSNDDWIHANGCTPTSTSSGGTVLHYKTLTVNAPCSSGASISVTEPDPGEVYTGGLLHIQWDSPNQGSSCKVKIYYRIANGPPQNIMEETNDDGGFFWGLSGQNINSNNVKVYIEYLTPNENGNIIGDDSGQFSIFTDLNAPIQTSPDDGTVFPMGTNSVLFGWDRNNPIGAADYELKIRDLTTNTILLNYLNIGDVNSYQYTSSNLIDGHEYRWVLRANNGSTTTELGARTFGIGNFDLELNTALSFGTSNLNENQTYTFTTQVTNIGTSNWSGSLYLKANEALPAEDLGAFNINAGQTTTVNYSFTPNGIHVGNNVPAEILYQPNGSGNSYSVPEGAFSNPIYINIMGSGLNITYPENGESFAAGDAITNISWTTAGSVGNISLELVTSTGTFVDLIANNIPNDSPYPSYTIPASTPPGQYKIKIYETGSGGFANFSDDPFNLTNPNSFDLQLSTGSSINPLPPIQSQNATFTAMIVNSGNQSWTGSLEMAIVNSNNIATPLDTDNNITLDPDETHILTHTSTPVTSQPGSYELLIRYGPGSSGPWTPVGSSSFPNPLIFTILNPSGDCLITNPPSSETENHAAAQYLCTNGIIDQPGSGDINPNGLIIKEDLAKVVFISLFDDPSTPTDADHFPVPFGDMQVTTNPSYQRYGKVLSYLEYGDGVSPFYRRFLNYRPGSNVTRGQVCKVLVEAFDIPKNVSYMPFQDVPSQHPEFDHIAKCANLGIVSSSQSNFRPDDNATRMEVFLMLYRLLDVCTNCPVPMPDEDDYFNPGNYIPENFAHHPSLADANFDSYAKTSFYIPGRNLPLVFEHNYNSYFTELPEELFCVWDNGVWNSFRPLGPGWSHTYNSYIVDVDALNSSNSSHTDGFIIFWPDGTMHAYQDNGSSPIPITKGIYDNINFNAGTQTYTITKKNQMVFTYKQLNTSNSNWPYVLKEIKDRNNNKIILNYEGYAGGGLRLKEAVGTAGRKLRFTYHGNTNKLHKVKDPLNREVRFTYGGINGEDLIRYWDAENFETVYNYKSGLGNEHLLEAVNLPNGNYIFNNYNGRKLTSTSTNNSGGPNTQQAIAWSLNAGPSAGTSATVAISNVGNPSYNFSYENNSLGNTTSMTTPTNDLDDASYDDPQNPTLPTSVTIDGLTTSYEYDIDGNVTKITQEEGVEHEFDYNSLNDIDSYTNPRNFETTFGYTSGNLTSIDAPIGTTTMSYNTYGQVETVTNSENITVTYDYDSYGNLEGIFGPLGINSSAEYDLVGRVKNSTNPNGGTSLFTYYDRDFIKDVTDPMNYTTHYDYDGNGNLIDVTNAQGFITHMEYDYFDWLESISFGGDTKTYDYEPDGKLKNLTKPDGTVLDYTYLTNGNLASNDYADFSYDSKNRLKTVTKEGKVLTFNYDNLHRITSTNFDGKTVAYQYDLNSNVKKITYPGNLNVNYTYDANDRLQTVKDWNNNITTYHYLSDGRRTQTDYPNGVKTYHFYDQAGRMDSTVTKKSSIILTAYGFDLDPMGNHLSENKTEPFAEPTFSSTSITNTFNDDNTLATSGGHNFSSNDNGARESEPDRIYSWDNHDMLLGISGNLNASFEYDGLGNRRKATIDGSTRKFVLDILGMSQVLIETDDNGTAQNYYVYGLGLISRIKPDNSTRYYHGDFRGSTIAMTDESGNISHSYQYDAFGEVLQENEEDDNPFKYVGKSGIMEDHASLYFMRARYYDPEQGRFLSEDPVWDVNLYAYGGNNPINNIDPSGNQFIGPGIIPNQEPADIAFLELGGMIGHLFNIDGSIAVAYERETQEFAVMASYGTGGTMLSLNASLNACAIYDKTMDDLIGTEGYMSVNFAGFGYENNDGSHEIQTPIASVSDGEICVGFKSFGFDAGSMGTRTTEKIYSTDIIRRTSSSVQAIPSQLQTATKELYRNVSYNLNRQISEFKSWVYWKAMNGGSPISPYE